MAHRREGIRSDDERGFVSALSDLKERGSALLVVGNVPDEEHERACARMLGDDASADRYRLFVSADAGSLSLADRLPGESARPNRDATRVVAWDGHSRSSAAASGSAPAAVPVEPVASENLAELGVAISREIAEIRSAADGLQPAELRLCFDSLRAVLDEHDRESVFRFLHVLVGRIRSVHGMAHFHLPVDRDAEVVHALAPLFDAVIELRVDRGRLQQRWRLSDPDLTTEWLAG